MFIQIVTKLPQTCVNLICFTYPDKLFFPFTSNLKIYSKARVCVCVCL